MSDSVLVNFPKCYKPFPDQKCSKSLRNVTDNIKKYLPHSMKMQENLKICKSCYCRILLKRTKIEKADKSPVPRPTEISIPESLSTVSSEEMVTESDTEVLVSCDFAENYSFIIQNSAQGFHWNNSQATIHPFVIYYKNIEDELCHYSFIVMSDCLHHDTVAVHLFIEKMMKFLKNKLSRLSKIYYVTDGAASQYKNKNNFKNVLKHKDDFGVDCEWHFHATSHAGRDHVMGLEVPLKEWHPEPASQMNMKV